MNEKTTGSFFILIQKRKKEEKIMLKYILKRLGLGIVTLFVLITITFFLTRLMPGNPFSSDNISATALAQLNSKYGLDKPLDQQYLLYMKNLLHGDLGVSYKKTGVSVNTIIAQGLPNTVSLGLSAFVFSLIVGVAMGIWMAATKKEWVRGILLTGTTLGVSIPNFVFAILLMLVFGVYLKVLPATGLTTPRHYILPVLAMQCCYPSKAGIATNENETWYTDPKTNLANGAFYMTEYVQGQYYKLKKNPNYYDADKVYLEDITVKFIDDATAAVSAYKTNEVDFATNLPAYVMSEYQGKSDLVLQPNITTRFILFNVTKAPFNNDKVRRAISMALSRAEICKTVGDDYEASTQFIAKYMLSNLGTGKKFSDESGEMVTEDIAKAKSLLAEAGYPNGAGFPTVTYNYPNNEQDKLIAQAIQAQLKSALNINVELNGMESQVCVSERKSGNFDMTRHNWTADYDDAMDYLLMWTSTSGLNDAGIKDADYDKLCEDATAELDETKRNTIMHDAEKLLVTDKAYVAPLATNKTICLLNPKYTGYSFDSSGQILLKFIKAAE